MVYDYAGVSDDAQVYGNASVFDIASVFGKALVYGAAQVCSNAQVHENSQVYDNAVIFGDAQICDNAQVGENSIIAGTAKICGNAQIFGHPRIKDCALIENANDWKCFNGSCRDDVLTAYRTVNGSIQINHGNTNKTAAFFGTIEEYREFLEKTYKNDQKSKKYYEMLLEVIEFSFNRNTDSSTGK